MGGVRIVVVLGDKDILCQIADHARQQGLFSLAEELFLKQSKFSEMEYGSPSGGTRTTDVPITYRVL